MSERGKKMGGSRAGLVLWGLAAGCALAVAPVRAQYIGFVYPAGGRQGASFPIRLGGQGLDAAQQVLVSGEGVSVRVVDIYRNLGNQELGFLRNQLSELQRGKSKLSSSMAATMMTMELPAGGGTGPDPREQSKPDSGKKSSKSKPKPDPAKQKLMDKLQLRLAADSRRPASRALSELVFAQVTVAPGAQPGRREIRVVTARGVSNPMVFYVGQVPEVARKPMKTADQQVLGKEQLAKRNRPPEEEEVKISVPCTMNGQIASGEVNRYRFTARKGQRLVVAVRARELVPFIADSVPGWFQPVLTLRSAEGKELAYNDDFQFKPDPALHFEVPADGEYVLSINDALYRGREDFVYRITVGEMPFVTSIFPLGGRAGEPVTIAVNGWNVGRAELAPPPADAGPGVHLITATDGAGLASNAVPFALDTLPECLEEEGNDQPGKAHKVQTPVIVNGRIDRPNDRDVFEIEGRAGETLVVEVWARRLDSPLDSFVQVTDAQGAVLAFNDDRQDAGAGMNTHHADSHVMTTLPSDGKYYVHLWDTARNGGQDYGYRLRIGQPRPDFDLRVVPPSLVLRGKSSATVTVYALRRDGFEGPVKLSFRDLPKGLSGSPATLEAGKSVARLTLKSSLTTFSKRVSLRVTGTATCAGAELVRQAVPAEDRMQAFLWRHLMPAQELVAVVHDPSPKPPAIRPLPPVPSHAKVALKPGEKPKFSEKQVAGLRRQLERLYQEWYLTDDFAVRELAKLQASN